MNQSQNQNPLIEFHEISKSFGSLKANDRLSFAIQHNSIHAIVGENGAGKSTAMKILFGLNTPDSGEIRLRGKLEKINSPIRARQLGIGMVQQHFVLAKEHTALDNILFSETTGPLQILKRSEKKTQYEALAVLYGFQIPWDKLVGDLTVGEQQRVEIFKVLHQNAEILILDEPTAVLTPQEVIGFFNNLKQLKVQGKTIILITHKLKEVLSVTDSMTILRQGRAVANLVTSETHQDEIAELMIGRRIKWHRRDLQLADEKSAGPVLQIQGDMELELRPHEIVGIAGVEGNGQLEIINGILNPKSVNSTHFKLKFMGQTIQNLSTAHIRKLSMGVFPEDRLRVGAIANANVAENFILGYDWDPEFVQTSIYPQSIKWSEVTRITQENLEKFDVRPQTSTASFGSFSGGNQQKIIVARELRRNPQFILAAQPTRGVDIGAIEFIHEQLLLAQERGAGILLVSTELDELLKMATRILVLYKNKFVLELQRNEFDEFKIGRAMGGLNP